MRRVLRNACADDGDREVLCVVGGAGHQCPGAPNLADLDQSVHDALHLRLRNENQRQISGAVANAEPTQRLPNGKPRVWEGAAHTEGERIWCGACGPCPFVSTPDIGAGQLPYPNGGETDEDAGGLPCHTDRSDSEVGACNKRDRGNGAVVWRWRGAGRACRGLWAV